MLVTFKVRVLHVWQTNFACYEVVCELSNTH